MAAVWEPPLPVFLSYILSGAHRAVRSCAIDGRDRGGAALVHSGRAHRKTPCHLTELGDVDGSDKVSESKNLEKTPKRTSISVNVSGQSHKRRLGRAADESMRQARLIG